MGKMKKNARKVAYAARKWIRKSLFKQNPTPKAPPKGRGLPTPHIV